MIAQCWLHIGTEKTGSTSIQTLLAGNRVALLARGWLYPQSAGATKHYNLVAFGLDDDRFDGTRRVLGIERRIGLDAFRKRLTASLASEIAASGATHLVLSNELLSTRLRNSGEIARLKTLCDSIASDTKVIVYIRNQADFLVSRYTNVIWEGGTQEFDFRGRPAIADYALLLDRWSQVFGKENLVVRRFEREEFPNGDVTRDFASAIGLDMEGLHMPRRANPSLDAESLAFLRALNRRLPRALSERVQPFRGVIVRVLQRRRGGTKFVIPRAEAQRIEAAYRESNERVAANYFGSRFRARFSPPVLVSKAGGPPHDRIGPLVAMRIAGFLVLGLLRDRVIWAGSRLLRRGRSPTSR
jgi:hypothetical protein